MKLNELLKKIQPVDIIGSTDKEIAGVCIDSRQAERGYLFMAMRGTQTDGHAYIPAAIGKGAVAVLCEELPQELAEGVTYIRVKDSEEAVGLVATTFYGDPTDKMELVGVTGTKQQGDENVRQPMPWTDVDAQEADPGSLLSAYRTLTALRNTYPALATGRMEKHPEYNDANAAYNQLAAWYMVDDASGQRLLVLHNFGPAATELPLTDKVQRPLVALGTVQQSTAADGTTQLRLGGYSSAVYLLE